MVDEGFHLSYGEIEVGVHQKAVSPQFAARRLEFWGEQFLMRWLKFASASLILAAVMIGMLSETAESTWLSAALSAAATYWVSGVLIIGLASILRLSLPEKWFHPRYGNPMARFTGGLTSNRIKRHCSRPRPDPTPS
jgi:hypothetical protein